MGLDVVEILMGWEEAFGISITDAEAEALLCTPRRTIDLIASKLAAQDAPGGACLTLRAFHRLRHSIVRTTGVTRDRVRPDVLDRTFFSLGFI